jgi:hypothetical protein
MKNIFFAIFVLSVFQTSFSQNLPQAFRFSDNSLRLIGGGVESFGFYDEANIDTIYLELLNLTIGNKWSVGK